MGVESCDAGGACKSSHLIQIDDEYIVNLYTKGLTSGFNDSDIFPLRKNGPIKNAHHYALKAPAHEKVSCEGDQVPKEYHVFRNKCLISVYVCFTIITLKEKILKLNFDSLFIILISQREPKRRLNFHTCIHET